MIETDTHFRLNARFIITAVALAAVVLASGAAAWAQDAADNAVESRDALNTYRLSPLDRLYIVVYAGDRLVEEIREYIKSDGTIYLPYIEQDVKLDGLTLIEAEALVERLSRSYVRDARVVITVLSSFSQSVSTYGMIENTTIELSTPMRILQVIARAGGPREDAKTDSVRVISRDGALRYFNYERVNKNPSEVENFFVKPGDIVFVPGIDDITVMVLGNVGKPGSYMLRQNERLLDAVIKAGSWESTADIKNVRLIRPFSPSKVSVQDINLKDIFDDGEMKFNYALRDGDIIFIPVSRTPILINMASSVISIIHSLITSYAVYVALND